MKKIKAYHLLALTLIISIISGLSTIASAKENGAPSANTGSPGDGKSCAHVDCHTGSAVPKDGLIITNVPASGYLSGETYLVTVTVEELDVVKFGFQASPQNEDGDVLGSMDLISATDTKFVGGGKYITHTLTGTAGTGSRTWTFNWTPEDAHGDVTFYVAVNASNNGDNASGDKIFTSSVRMSEDPDNIPLTIEQINNIRFDIQALVQDELNLTVATAVNDAIIIDIIDLHGRLVSANSFDYSNGTFSLPVDNLNSGMYFVRISNAQGATTKQFFKN
ncbi:MAG: choice-of-anchor V domain-containing protein [Chitinophagales bacterium]